RVFHPRDGHRRLLKLLMETGAKLSRSPESLGLDGAQQAAAAYAREASDRVFIDGQRRESTAEALGRIAQEIVHALGDIRLGGFVTSVSTGATLKHVAHALRLINPDIEVAGVMLDAPEERQALYDGVPAQQRSTPEELKEVRGEIIQVAEIEAWRMRSRIARSEGMLIGPKGAAAVLGALQIRHVVPPDQAIVALSIDGGQRYLSAIPNDIALALASP
ncbi:MAG: pyridoxal-phosphate dependent enzyme, partial [Myxococcota bacterium]